MTGCDFLDPLPDGSYNDDNFNDYPELLRGFVDKVYNDFMPDNYYTTYYMGLDAATDDLVYRAENATWRVYARGAGKQTDNPFTACWNESYEAINYLNLFLKDNVGYNTRYMVDAESDAALRKCIQGDAYGLRAWFLLKLMRMFAGKGTNGILYGVPLRLEPTDATNIDRNSIYRTPFEDCMQQIINDCDSALVYLHYNHRDYPEDAPQAVAVTGSARFKTLDQIAIYGLKAMTYLFWASPAFNVDNNPELWRKAAYYASLVMKHKLEKESTLPGGFNPTAKFIWEDCNSPEIIWCSEMKKSNVYEVNLYPKNFGGSANLVPTQELVDAFPMKNGYPITDPLSGYDPTNPYANRDPRFYASILHNGSKIIRTSTLEEMYTIESYVGGKDGPGGNKVSPTGYYVNKYLYKRWNPFDHTVETAYRSVHFMGWTQMCLIFAEAANKVVGPLNSTEFGISAKQAISWLRSRPSSEGVAGIGATSDPYLDKCAADPTLFEELVKNEWRVETCFEGTRYYNLRRWTTNASDLNGPVHGVSITKENGSLKYEYKEIDHIKYPSLWAPIPYSDLRKCPNLVQNEGWKNWR